MKVASDRLLRAVGRSGAHDLAIKVEVLHRGEKITEIETTFDPAADDVQPVDGTVTLDAKAESRGRLAINFADPLLVPKTYTDPLMPYVNELRVWRGVQWPDQAEPELISLGFYPIQDAEGSAQPGELALSLDCMDRSKHFIDATMRRDGLIQAGSPVDETILNLAWEVWPDVPYDFVPAPQPLPLLEYSLGDNRWELMVGCASAINGELFFDSEGVLVLRPRAEPMEGAPNVVITEGGVDGGGNRLPTYGVEYARGVYDTDGNLVSINRSISRDADVFNLWTVFPEAAEDLNLAPGVAIDDAPSSPTRFGGRFGSKPAPPYSNRFITTTQQAQDAAEGLRARDRGLLDAVNLAAYVNPALEPGDTARVIHGGLDIAREFVIDTLNIPLSADGAMDGVMREVRLR